MGTMESERVYFLMNMVSEKIYFLLDEHGLRKGIFSNEHGRPAVYQIFSRNHLSYTKTLVLIYRFRAITFFYAAAILGDKMTFLPQRNYVMSFFSRSHSCSSSIQSRYMLGHIWGLD